MMSGMSLRFRYGCLILCASLISSMHGCGGQKTGGLTREGTGSRAGSAGGGDSSRILDPLDNPAGTTASGWVKLAVQPLGTVPYDNMVLPLVSPDGRMIATQTGIAPKWSTVLAEPGAELPILTRIEVYALDHRENLQPDQPKPPAKLYQVDETAILGRSCDAEGFLIESPREDGSRWIGKVSWQDGSVRWLVNGPDVNAFGSLGSRGELAWSRRIVGSQHFDLVVRSAGGGEWAIPSQDDDWLMPTWSGRGDALFAFNLKAAKLQLRFAPASSAQAFRSAMQPLPLVGNAKVYHAYQSTIAQSGPVRSSQIDQITFFHPGVQRMAVWRPMAMSGQRTLVLAPGSLAALPGDDDFAFVTMDRDFVRQNIRDARTTMNLIAGMHIPRPTPLSKWPCVLLSPEQDRVGLVAIQMIPSGEAPSAVAAR